jgi:hypothetical protein
MPAAKNAVGRVFFDYYFVTFRKKLNGIVAVYIEIFPHFLRNDKTAKLIYISHYSGGFHGFSPILAILRRAKFF